MKTILIDGIDAFKSLFANDKEFIDHVIENIMFIDKNMVREQALDIRKQVRLGKAIPVRYNSNGAFFLQHKVKTTTPSFKNRSEAISFTNAEENALFHRDTKIRVCFDRDGNYYPKQAIYQYTHHRVSCGALSTVANYTIAHIWNKTDKRDDSHPIVKHVKDLIKAVSIELYNPNHIMDWNQNVLTEREMPPAETFKEAKALIKENRIKFLPINTTISPEITPAEVTEL